MQHFSKIQSRYDELPAIGSPPWLAPTIAVLFAILWGVWLLPHTVFVRHSCMVLGGLLGLYVCFTNYRLFFRKEAAAFYCMALLFLWVSFHLLFIGKDNAAQLDEYFGTWKKVFICTPFALGLGFAISQSQKAHLCWKIFYIGLLLPTIIYFIKLTVTHNANTWGVTNPHLLLDANATQSLFGVSRALYTFYCMPSFAVAIFALLNSFHSATKYYFFYVASLVLTPTLFFLEGDRTGLLISGLLLMLATIGGFYQAVRGFNLKSILVSLVFFIGFAVASLGFIKKFDHWRSMVATAKVAFAVDTYDEWKFQGLRGYPKNELGETTEGSNYERIAWATAGTKLLFENPQGYGLLTLSFDHLTKKKWPDSHLSMTHSGWIDFALGYGIPGLFLLFSASLICWRSGFYMSSPWSGFVIWGFGSLNIIFLMKELSNEICVNAFIFIILFIASLSTSFHSNSPKNHK